MKFAAKIQKKIIINKLKFKIMENVFQIVAKGVASNKIIVVDSTSYRKFEKLLEEFTNSQMWLVLTTNVYIKYE